MHLVIWSLVIPQTDTTPTQTNFRVTDFVCQIWKFLGCLNPWWREQIEGHYQIYPKYSDTSTDIWTSPVYSLLIEQVSYSLLIEQVNLLPVDWTSPVYSQFTPCWLNKSVYSLLIEQVSLLPVYSLLIEQVQFTPCWLNKSSLLPVDWTSQFTPCWLNRSVCSLLIEQVSLLPVYWTSPVYSLLIEQARGWSGVAMVSCILRHRGV